MRVGQSGAWCGIEEEKRRGCCETERDRGKRIDEDG
jgi:hypothetical protein